MDVEEEADFTEGGNGSIEEELEVLQFALLPRVCPADFVGDELGVGLENGFDDAELVGAEGGAGFGDFDNGVSEFRRPS